MKRVYEKTYDGVGGVRVVDDLGLDGQVLDGGVLQRPAQLEGLLLVLGSVLVQKDLGLRGLDLFV